MSDANKDEERAPAGEASASVSVSNNGEIDLLDTTTIPTAEAEEGTTDIRADENEDDEFHDTQASLPKEEEVEADFSIEAVTKLVNEVRGVDATESPLLSQKIEAMEQGSSRPFYRDDPSSRSSMEAYSDDDYDYSTSIPPAGIWSTTSTQRPQLQSTRRRRFNYVRSCLRSKYSMYCVIVTTLIAIGVGISAAVTKGFEYSEHRNELLHPKWENDGIVQDDQEQQQQQQLDEETDTTTLPKNDLSENNNEGSIMQSDISSTSSPLPEQVYTDAQQTLSYQIANTYIPIWFDRESGWNGSTHAEAMEFCKSFDDTSSLGFVPCPYDVYCPGGGGDGAKVLFDEEVDEADSWAPVLETNKWVQVGSGGRVCESVQMDDLGEKLTRHIMCCLEQPLELGGGVVFNSADESQESTTTGGDGNVPPNVKDENGDGNVEDPIPPPPMTSSSSISTNNVDETSSEMDMPPVENELFVEYRPAWFRHEQGWSGTTYEDGKQFCESVKDGPNSLDTLQLCPLEVYCPKGPGYDKPLYYEMDTYAGEQWAPVSDGSDRWVMLGDEGYQTCAVNPPDVSVGTLSTSVKRYILCCRVPAQDTDLSEDNSLPEGGIENAYSQTSPTSSLSSLVSMSNPVWFSDEKGWSGTTHEDGKQFCESMKVGPNPDDTFHLCPLEVYCPKGEVDDKPLYYEMDAFQGEQWAPISDSNDLWVMLGNEGYQTCAVNQPAVPVGSFPPKFKRYILCCQDNPEISSSNVVGGNSAEVPEVDLEHFDFEDSVSGELNPVWYGTDEWISGSYEDASHFCNFKGKSLCPYAAYCPYGPGTPPVDGWVASKEFEEQWAPTATTNNWVLIGAENDNPFSQCKVTESPSFGFDKSQSDLKLHIMCCDELHSEAETSNAGNSEGSTQEAINSEASSSSATFESFGPPPVWYHSTDGWNGGGHEAAILFCLSKEKTLCPVEVICPNGPKKSLVSSFGGDTEPEQWAPASDKENYWIMIGAYNNDDTTICQDQDDILGGYPVWGLDDSYSQHKRHILCCSSI